MDRRNAKEFARHRHRCSPATKHMLAGCVVDCTVSCKAPGQLGPMLTQADFVVLTKVDMISQAEMEIICWQIGQINPQAKIFPVDALAGYGIDLLAQWLLTQPLRRRNTSWYSLSARCRWKNRF